MRKIYVMVMILGALVLSAKEYGITVPETQAVVQLGENLSSYVDGYERGVVKGDFKKKITRDEKTLIPFIVSNQGSGIFYYVALFQNDVYVKSFFVGDRVKIEKISLEKDELSVKFTTRENTQEIKKFSVK